MRALVFSLLLAVLFAAACRKGDIRSDGIPDTRMSVDAINLSGENRLNSSVRLSWFGTDADGYVVGYEISLDANNWFFTEAQDSVFLFDIPPGQDTADIDFYVRAIDNDGNVDPSPAYLQVPLINTPPEATLLNDRGPGDTAFIAATFFWQASDPDGDNTLEDVQIRVNEGPWVSINRGQNIFTLLPDTSVQSGEAEAQIYYGQSTAPSGQTVAGLRVNDTNRIYIRAIDIAQAVSPIDTADLFYFRSKSSGTRILWLSGHPQDVTNQYRTFLDGAGLRYDLFNVGFKQGENLPKYFDPTVQLIFAQYDQAFLNLPNTSFTNTITGVEESLLSSLAPVIQRFSDQGGQYMLTTIFSTGENISNAVSVYPISRLSESTAPGSQARIVIDSALVPLQSGNFPNLQPQSIQSGVVPMVATTDAEDFYRAQLTPLRGWNGPSDVVAAVRRPNNRLTQVFFALELHNFDRPNGSVTQLISEIFNNEF